MRRRGRLIAVAVLAALPAGGHAVEFSYRYLELAADLSKTENTAADPVEEDAGGRLLGVSGSWEAFDSFYLKGAWSRETKEFGNEVAGTPVDLDSEQTMLAAGAGYHFEAGERTGVYAEALAIVDFEVEHLVPVVVPSRFGPPSVSTVDSTIEGNGFAAALGVRHRVGESVELEAQLSRTHTRGDVLRTGEEFSDSETMLRAGGHVHVGGGVSVGAFFSYARHTDVNFDNIRKLGVSLRYHF